MVSVFFFISSPRDESLKRGFVSLLPAGIIGKQSLFLALERELSFPDYFGRNWDALYECLMDLNWLASREISLVHPDLPLLDSQDLKSYLSVLAAAVVDVRRDVSVVLHVYFPEGSRADLGELGFD